MRLVVDKFKVITDKKLKKPLRVVFISDTHFGEHPLTAGKWNGNSTLKGLRKLGKIDLILFGGDYVNSALVFKMRYPLKNFTDFLKACAEIAPVIMIRGNHDLYLNNRATEEIYQKFGSIENVTLLDNAQMKFKGIEITGFTPRHSSYDLIKHGKRSHKITMEDFGGAKFKFKKEDFNLIVTHSPYSLTNKRALREFPEVFENSDVVISGHLHNGAFASKNFEGLTRKSNNKSSKHLLRISIDKGIWLDPKTGFVANHCRGAKLVGEEKIGRAILPSSKNYIEIDLRKEENRKKLVQVTGKGIHKFSVIPLFPGRPSIVELVIDNE